MMIGEVGTVALMYFYIQNRYMGLQKAWGKAVILNMKKKYI